MRSAVLDQLSGPQCDEVLGRRRSATMLAELARANVPFEPVDASHEWYRLHGLFREMLQAELRRSPDRRRGRSPPARGRNWYRRAGDIDRALDHAMCADDPDRAGQLLWAHLHRYLGHGRNDTVQRWLRRLTADRIAGCAPLALSAAHSGLALGSVAVATRWARSAAVQLVAGACRTDTARAGRRADHPGVGGALGRPGDGPAAAGAYAAAARRQPVARAAAAFCRARLPC